MNRWCLVALAAALSACTTPDQAVPQAVEPPIARVLVMTAMPIELPSSIPPARWRSQRPPPARTRTAKPRKESPSASVCSQYIAP